MYKIILHFYRVNVILLTLHHLNRQSYGISNNGFFHYKIHICSFIDRHWHLLFGAHTKQKKNWVGTIAGVLSIYNNLLFQSGSVALGETGWWKLLHNFSPAVAAHIVQGLAKDKPKGRPKNQMALTKTIFLDKVLVMGYGHLVNDEEPTPAPVKPAPFKKRRLDTEGSSSVSMSYNDQLDSDNNFTRIDDLYSDDLPLVSKDGSHSDVENIFRGFDFTPAVETVPLHDPILQSDSSSIHSLQQMLGYDSDSSHSPNCQPEVQSDCEIKKSEPIRPKKTTEDKPYDKRESLFSTELNSVDMPWVDEPPETRSDLVEMTQYEELQLLKQVEGLIPKVKDVNKKAELYRLKAKLSLRRLKRHKHLPLFDLDKTVKILGGYVTEDSRVVNAERVLDRFQQTYLIDNLCGTIASTNYGTLVVSRTEPTPFRSMYSGAMLKPYIRRDAESSPTWLRLMDELLRRTNRHVENYRPPPRATIDYSYVRPQHIAAVNNLCAQFFWPGIDLTESLQYPEFSCVVTYRQLVVGCAFLVPDVGPNEAYISFVLTRPEWRNAKIASFMLYHLLQTCSGKDVTLHVSPTNPAIFLYQKFGFKVEELIQDFYEKYYDIDYKGCRHALFLRLIR
ncbi:cysteine-rich protein 2-binding protein isoform X2 [Galleria mellonella]|uniref:Cysteine-rich protein 2-binding protein isoform X2 n=1 Tax=Galleria mellonella TaxID=7137 RepID=A0ABM3MBI8_GALME|nr:cysteine-rich protein 2-binding protein isoform X2 [Galleria mellonella]